MGGASHVVRVSELPAGIKALAKTAEREGFAHVARLVDDFAAGENRFTQPGEALFVYYAGTQLVGVGGVNQDPYDRRPYAGRIRRVYVHPDYRRQRVASALMAALEQHAREYFESLNLFTTSPEADRFYRQLGYSRQYNAHKISHTKALEPHGPSKRDAG